MAKINNETWEYVVEELEKAKLSYTQFSDFCDLLGSFDMPWTNAYWEIFDSLVNSLSKLVHDSDDSWICYYIYDCEWGENPRTVYFCGEEFLLDSWEKVRFLIENCGE